MEAIFATIESFFSNMVDLGTLKSILDFIVNFLKTFALIG